MLIDVMVINREIARKLGVNAAVLLSELTFLYQKADDYNKEENGFMCDMNKLTKFSLLSNSEIADALDDLKEEKIIHFGTYWEDINVLEVYIEEDEILNIFKKETRK